MAFRSPWFMLGMSRKVPSATPPDGNPSARYTICIHLLLAAAAVSQRSFRPTRWFMVPPTDKPFVSGERILLVDGEPTDLRSLETILEAPGRHFVRASSGEQALRLL